MSKLISVIVPCYNAAAYVDACIESVINQTIGIEHIQLIIVDDASTDESVEHVLKYVKEYPESIYLETLSENVGQAAARNIGTDLAEAPYLVYIDADDWVTSDFCEKMLAVVEEQECDLIQCGWVEHYDETQIEKNKEIRSARYNEIITVNSAEDRKQLFKENSFSRIIGCSVLRTKWLHENGIRFKSYRKYEDNYYDSIIRYQVGTYCAIPENLYYYRILKKSNSHARNDMDQFVRLEIEVEKVLYYQKHNLFQTYYSNIRNEFFRMFYLNTLHIIFLQFDDIPLDIIEFMQQTVRKMFPDYAEGIPGADKENEALLTLRFRFPKEQWEQYKQAYLECVINGNALELRKFYEGMKRAVAGQ